MKKRWVRVALWALVLGIMAGIYAFSCQDGERSMETSGIIAVPVARWLAGMMPQFSFEQVLEVVQVVVRKTAHFSEYALLGCAIRWLMMSYEVKRSQALAWVAGTGYAGTDELHQLLSGERTGMLQDVALDSVGVLAGTVVAMAVVNAWHRRRKRTG